MGGAKNNVVVYFTSHNLFYTDTVECFEKAIKEKIDMNGRELS